MEHDYYRLEEFLEELYIRTLATEATPDYSHLVIRPTEHISDLKFGPIGNDWGCEVTYPNGYTAVALVIPDHRLPRWIGITMWDVIVKHGGEVVTDTPISGGKDVIGPLNISWLQAVLSVIKALPSRGNTPAQ
jgi:hypothetical protein